MMNGGTTMNPQSESAIDRAAALDRLGGDVELLEELLVLMIEQSQELVDQIRTGLSQGDAKAVLVAAHTIKGSAANLEANDLARAAQVLESLAHGEDLGDAPAAFAAVEAEFARFIRDAGA
jgi:two-component system, sensor histidine kinase and response regulator